MERTQIIRLVAAVMASVVFLGLSAPAQSIEKTVPGASVKVSTNSASGKKSPSGHPFHGKLAAIDKSAKTITVGKSVYHVTAETKIKKDGKPATLDSGVIGEPASGFVKPASDGTMTASTVTFGAKPDSKGSSASSKKK